MDIIVELASFASFYHFIVRVQAKIARAAVKGRVASVASLHQGLLDKKEFVKKVAWSWIQAGRHGNIEIILFQSLLPNSTSFNPKNGWSS
jgi:hypothetical protein